MCEVHINIFLCYVFYCSKCLCYLVRTFIKANLIFNRFCFYTVVVRSTAWIEIVSLQSFTSSGNVVVRSTAWIEICYCILPNVFPAVAVRSTAWIEIKKLNSTRYLPYVAVRSTAWIEMAVNARIGFLALSPYVVWRGLKYG